MIDVICYRNDAQVMADGFIVVGAGLDADDLAEQAFLNAGRGNRRRIGKGRGLRMAGFVAAVTSYHQLLKGGGFLRVAFDGGMPMLQQPNVITDVGQGIVDLLIADTASSAMDRELGGIIAEPDDLPGFCRGKETIATHG